MNTFGGGQFERESGWLRRAHPKVRVAPLGSQIPPWATLSWRDVVATNTRTSLNPPMRAASRNKRGAINSWIGRCAIFGVAVNIE